MDTCHGCGRLESLEASGYCPACEGARAKNLTVTVAGRTLLLSEVAAQAAAGDEVMLSYLASIERNPELSAALAEATT